jgi:hypothetical protein
MLAQSHTYILSDMHVVKNYYLQAVMISNEEAARNAMHRFVTQRL